MNTRKAWAEERNAKGTLVLADDVLLREWTNRLRSGETGDSAHGIARFMIDDFCSRAWLNKPQSQYTLSWLADVLSDVIDNGKPDARRAFSLMPNREGGHLAIGEAIDIACWVKLTIDRGYTEAEAHELAAATFHKDPRHIRRQRAKASSSAEGINPKADWNALFLLKNRPLPAAKKRQRQQRTRTR